LPPIAEKIEKKEKRKENRIIRQIRGGDPLPEVMRLINDGLACNAC